MKAQLKPPFSLTKYLFVIILLSWPFQFAYGILGEPYRPLLLISMVMVAVGTYISGKFLFHDDFKKAGWRIGKPKHYIVSFLFVLLIWHVPTIIEYVSGLHSGYSNIKIADIFYKFLISFFITLVPAFSEEFGWRGYLLPKLTTKYAQRKALLIHGLITWVWHVPVLVIMGIKMEGNFFVTIPGILLISLIPTVMHAIIFAYIWSVSGSLAVSTFYHAAFDEVRDSLQNTVGFGPLIEVWQMIVIILTGLILLTRAKWNLMRINNNEENI